MKHRLETFPSSRHLSVPARLGGLWRRRGRKAAAERHPPESTSAAATKRDGVDKGERAGWGQCGPYRWTGHVRLEDRSLQFRIHFLCEFTSWLHCQRPSLHLTAIVNTVCSLICQYFPAPFSAKHFVVIGEKTLAALPAAVWF